MAAHIGKYTNGLEGTAAIIPPETFASGTQIIVAANGDQLTGSFALESMGVDPTAPHETTIVTTVTGGTGRF